MLTYQSQNERYEDFLQHFLQDQVRIFSYVRSLLPQYADEQDVFQRCSLSLWWHFDQFDQQRLFLPRACTIALNEVRNFRRASGRDRLQLADELIEQLAERRKGTLAHRDRRSSALRSCVESLKQADRDLVQLVYGDSQPVEEIAKSKGKAMQTLYNRLAILRRQLLQSVANPAAGDGFHVSPIRFESGLRSVTVTRYDITYGR